MENPAEMDSAVVRCQCSKALSYLKTDVARCAKTSRPWDGQTKRTYSPARDPLPSDGNVIADDGWQKFGLLAQQLLEICVGIIDCLG